MAVQSLHQGVKRRRLRNAHDRLERERSSMRVVAIRDPADGVPKDLDRGLRHVLVVVGCTCLAKVLQFPRLFLAGFNVELGLDSSQPAELFESRVGPGASAQKHRAVRIDLFLHNASDVSVDGTIHWPIKRLAGLHSLVEDPTPG